MNDEQQDPKIKLIEKVANRGVFYNNDLIDEFFEKFIEPINLESIKDKSDEELIEMTRSNWVNAYIYGIYSFEGKKVVIDRGWEIDIDIFEHFRSQFENAYREASLGFGHMVGDTMRVILGPRPHLKKRMLEFIEKERLMNELKDEAKIRASKNPHPGIPDLSDI
jgi:hypothetical protein